MSINFQLVLEQTIKKVGGSKPKLLLHSCCAPCSSYVLEYLSNIFDITIFFYNPNIYPEQEYYYRRGEQQRLLEMMNLQNKVKIVGCEYQSEEFYTAVKGLENCKEGGQRCQECFRLRLGRCAEYAADNGFDYFTTTLTISPHKNSQLLNAIGEEVAKKVGVEYLYSDFKKKNGYKRSCELSAQYGLYRQDYCGCVFSKKQKEE